MQTERGMLQTGACRALAWGQIWHIAAGPPGPGAWGLEPQSRLSCQAIVAKEDLTVEIPRYSINHAKEKH